MKTRLSLVFLMFLTITCNGQVNKKAPLNQDIESTQPYLYGIPDNVASQDTSPGWNQRGQKILLTGKVYFQDGKTPAPNVLIYYYHTNIDGKYLHMENVKRSLPPNSKGQTHGYLRGWVKTDSEGNYSIYTVRPGAYPGVDEPAHIHLTIKEPDMEKPYRIDESVFDDDRLLTTAKRIRMGNRGGSGILRLVTKGELRIGERNIILGLNIPDYPRK